MKRTLGCLAAALTLGAVTANAQTVSIGTTRTGTLNNNMGVAIGTLLHRHAKVQTRVTPYSGTEQFVPLVNAGEADLAIPSATDAYFAYKGEEVYDKRPNQNLRAVATLFPLFLSVMVKDSSGIKGVPDLKGRTVSLGYTNHAQARRYFRGILASWGISESDLKGNTVPHVIAGVRDLMQGKTDATMFAVGVPKNAEIQAKVGTIRFLNANHSPEGIARLRKFVPTADVLQMKPKKGRIGIIEPTYLLAERYMVVTNAKVSDKVIYDLAKLFYEKQKEFVAIVPIFRLYKPKQLSRDQGMPFHPGAEKFYREVGAWQKKS